MMLWKRLATLKDVSLVLGELSPLLKKDIVPAGTDS